MFVFVISLRHPKNANNFAHVEKLLSITLQSICGQTDPNFKVIVVCNEKPNVSFQDERIHYHVVAFDAPSDKKAAALENQPKFLDKGTKYLAGLLYAEKFDPKYVCIFDADDWLNKNFVKEINQAPDYPVWYVNKGYMVNYQTKEYKNISGFNRYCGSSFVYDYQYLMSVAELKAPLTQDSTQDEMVAATSDFYISQLLANHTITYRLFDEKGTTPQEVPLNSACWLQATGENVSGTKGRNNGVPIDARFAEEFSLPKEMLSVQKPSLAAKIHNGLFALRSAYTWEKSKRTGKVVY